MPVIQDMPGNYVPYMMRTPYMTQARHLNVTSTRAAWSDSSTDSPPVFNSSLVSRHPHNTSQIFFRIKYSDTRELLPPPPPPPRPSRLRDGIKRYSYLFRLKILLRLKFFFALTGFTRPQPFLHAGLYHLLLAKIYSVFC